MTLYADASSLAKLYIVESGAEAVGLVIRGAAAVMTSRVTYAEIRAALARARRGGRLNDVEYGQAVGDFNTQWQAIVVLEVTQQTVERAGELAERHPLRGFDAIHLASAISGREPGGEPPSFSTWDSALLAAARAEGLTPAH